VQRRVEPQATPPKEVKKAERKPSEKRRVARSNERRETAQASSPPAQPKGVISQIPLIGPVVGLVLPF
jgi:hypothetical protein